MPFLVQPAGVSGAGSLLLPAVSLAAVADALEVGREEIERGERERMGLKRERDF